MIFYPFALIRAMSYTERGCVKNDTPGKKGFIMEMSTWYILAQIMGVITICFEFVSYQIPDQRKYLLVTSIGNIFWAMMFLFMGFHTSLASVQAMIVAAAFGTLRGLIFWWIFAKNTRKRHIAGRIALYSSLIIVLSATLVGITKLPYTQQIIIQSVGLVGGMLFIVGQYLPSKHYLRIFVTFYATMMLIGNTPLNLINHETGETIWNVMGILIEAAKIISVIVFYVLLVHRSRLRRKLKEVKKAVNHELDKITACSDTSQLVAAKVISADDLEKLAVKMIKYQLGSIDTSSMKDIQSTLKRTQSVLKSVETAQGVQELMETLVEAEKNQMDQKPIPRISRFHKPIREVWTGEEKLDEEE